MSNKDILKKKVHELESIADEIYQLALILLQKMSFNEFGYLNKLDYQDTPSIEIQRKALRKYQSWYASAKVLVVTYAPEWEEAFIENYRDTDPYFPLGILDLLSFHSDIREKSIHDVIGTFNDKFERQVTILLSLPDIVELKELNLRKIITADLARTEIEQAEILLSNNFERAAGSIAGVALELHLKTLCDINGVSYSPKATIQPLIQALQKEGKLDITEAKHIEHLASIRNKCSHPSNITETEVKTLIDGVKKII